MRTVDQMLTEPMDPADKTLLGLAWTSAAVGALISVYLRHVPVPLIVLVLAFQLLASFMQAFTGSRRGLVALLVIFALCNASGLYTIGVLHGRAESSQGSDPAN